MSTSFTSGGTSNLDGLNVSGATSLSQGPTIGSAPTPTPSGSAPLFSCRAWVSFTGSTGNIIANGNVSGVVRNSTGSYTITFATPMTDALYAVIGNGSGGTPVVIFTASTATNSVTISAENTTNGAALDPSTVYVAIFR
jgi:hypothetical protein